MRVLRSAALSVLIVAAATAIAYTVWQLPTWQSAPLRQAIEKAGMEQRDAFLSFLPCCMSDPEWASWNDEQLLALRLCDLGLSIEGTDLVSYPGGWAEYRERSAPEAEPPPPPKAKTKRRTEKKQEQSPLELVEREIERGEGRVAELERQLAEDWTNVDLVTAHRVIRVELLGCAGKFLRLQHIRNFFAQHSNQGGHIIAKLCSHSRWKLDGPRLMFHLEVVNVNPVEGRFATRSALFQKLSDGGCAA